jgi:probable F420-dependent oxidoreductase
MRPRLGVSSLGTEPAAWPDWCRQVEALGLDEVSVADHLKPGVLPPMTALAAAAVATEHLGLSTMVINNELRHPAVLASEAAVLSELSSGRFTLGIGAGHAEDEHAAIGVPVPPPEERIARLGSTVRALRALFAGETVTTDEPYPSLKDHALSPVPTRPVPILVGGGARRVQELAARHADVLGLTGFSARGGDTELTHFTADAVTERLEWVRSLPREHTDRLRLQALVQLVAVTADRRAAAEATVAAWGARDLTVDEALESPFLLFGSAGEIAAQLHERTERYGIETWTVFVGRPVDAPLEDLGRIASCLRG